MTEAVAGSGSAATDGPFEGDSSGVAARGIQSRGGTRQRIIEEAGLLFAERGYRGASIAEIEKRAGLAPGAGGLYRHFSSKEELLLEVVRAYKERLRLLRERHALELERSLDLERTAGFADDSFPAGNQSQIGRLGQDGVHLGAEPKDVSVANELWAVLRTLAEFLRGEQAMIRIGAETGSLPTRARHELAEAWNEGYGFLSDLFTRHGCAPALADALAVSALGSLAHYFTQLGDSSLPPMGVAPLDYVVAWVDQWATLVEVGFGSSRNTGQSSSSKLPSFLEEMSFQEGMSFLDAVAASRMGSRS